MALEIDTEGLHTGGPLPGPAAPKKKKKTTTTASPGLVPTANTPTATNAGPVSGGLTVGPNTPGPTTDNPPTGFNGPLPEGPVTKANKVLQGILAQFLGQPRQRSVPRVSGGASGTSFLSSLTNSFSRVPTAPGSKLGFKRNRSDENDRIKTSSRGVLDNAPVRRNKAGARKQAAKGTR